MPGSSRRGRLTRDQVPEQSPYRFAYFRMPLPWMMRLPLSDRGGKELVSAAASRSRKTYRSVSLPVLGCVVAGVLARAMTSRSWWRLATPSLG